jgi:hypothetical protein
MNVISNDKRNITPAMAVKILKKNNVDISEDRAKEVLDLLYILAKLTVKTLIKDQNDNNGS